MLWQVSLTVHGHSHPKARRPTKQISPRVTLGLSWCSSQRMPALYKCIGAVCSQPYLPHQALHFLQLPVISSGWACSTCAGVKDRGIRLR